MIASISRTLPIPTVMRPSSAPVAAAASTDTASRTPEQEPIDEAARKRDEEVFAAALASRQREKEYALRDAEHAAFMEAHRNRESNEMIAPNVATLDYETVKKSIAGIASTIRNENPDSYRFDGANGAAKTSSIHQYYDWLQQREKELTNDGTYSPSILLSK